MTADSRWIRSFRNLPINRKMIVIVMVVTAATLVMSAVGIVAADRWLFRESLERDVSATGRIIADNSTAALAFNDRASASETLASLRARPHMAAACLYSRSGELFSHYSRFLGGVKCPDYERPVASQTDQGALLVHTDVLLKGQKLGSLLLIYDLEEIAGRTRLYSAIVIGVFLVGAFLAFLLSRNLRSLITAPILQLAAITTAVSETNNYGLRARRNSSDELGTLIDRFNEMLDGIQSREATLTSALLDRQQALQEAERAKERFRFMAESMPQKIFTATPSGEVNYLNRQWQEFSGNSLQSLMNQGWLNLIHPFEAETIREQWWQSVQTGQPFFAELRFKGSDDEFCWHLARAHAMHDEHGKILMWIGSLTEIQQQKEKENELRRVNEDLQQFVYSASHDLQEPVRNVAIYSELVATRYDEQLDSDGQQYLGFLKEGGRRLSMLIRDLLSFTRAGALEIPETPTDSAAVLNQTLSLLTESIRENGALVTYGELPKVFMEEAQLQQLFQNLISNAIKYRTDDPPQIHISADRQAEDWRFCVRDNGIGINPIYKEKIFGVFKRLHHNDKYGGTGIGLAICKRVVECYGGRIWVESEEGRGSAFFFTIPVKQAQRSFDSFAG